MITCKRIYDTPEPADGQRILVDRLWPRGVAKQNLHMDLWLKDVAPSTPLRQWFHQHLDQQDEFIQRYRSELMAHLEHWILLLDFIKQGNLTLLYSAKNTVFNHALVLADFLEDELEKFSQASSPVCYIKAL